MPSAEYAYTLKVNEKSNAFELATKNAMHNFTNKKIYVMQKLDSLEVVAHNFQWNMSLHV